MPRHDGTNHDRSQAVRALRPVRVLLAVEDARFIRAAAFLFERAGFLVESTRHLNDVLGAAERSGANVVILDGSASMTAAERIASVLAAGEPAVRVIVVADGEADRRFGLPTFPKWSVGSLIDEIERLCGVHVRPHVETSFGAGQ